MDRRYTALLVLLLFSVSIGGSVLAQDSPSNSSPAAQSGQAAQAVQPSPQSTSSAALLPAPNRVWTNDDLPDLRAGTGVSNHVVPRAKSSRTVAKPATISKGKDANWYHGQIAKLQAQLPPIESQMSNYQAALAGKPVDETRVFGWTRPADWSAQLAKLQQKHDDISGKIAALEDEARHNSIPANSLP